MDDLKRKLVRHFFSTPQRPFSREELEDAVHFGSMYDIPGFINSLDGVKLDLVMNNVVEFWKIASNHKMEGLMKQVATFLSKEPVDKQWPVDLIIFILSLNREEIEKLKKKQKEETLQKRKRKGGNTSSAKRDGSVLRLRVHTIIGSTAYTEYVDDSD